MVCFMFLVPFLATCSGFKVSVPAGRIVAVRGRPAILGCEFTPDPTSDLSLLAVTWQRVEDSRVVHSFYFKQDQLKLQSPEYSNRTSLFVSEFRKGNAALRIEPVGLSDMGMYLCTVSDSKGTDNGQVQLEYGAFYTEPRLSMNINCSTITLLYESEGFPKPEVRWLVEDDNVLGNHTDLSDGVNGAAGIYHLKSRFVSPSSFLNVTFRLKNQLLDQVLNRPVSITYDGASCSGGDDVKSTPLVVLCVLCLMLIIVIIILMLKVCRVVTWCHSYKLSNGGTDRKQSNEY